MILKIKHFDEAVFRGKMEHLKDVPFTLFVDDIPQSQEDLSEINVLVLQEPNEYFGLHDWAVANKHYFSVILTWDEKVLNNCDNAMFLPFGHTWFRKAEYEKTYDKTFQVSHLAGALNKTYGHSLRHELTARENELKIPTNFYKTYGNRSDINDARKGKIEVFGGSQFGVAIENTNHRGYFTEKILDLFLLKTIPIYWGCSNIGDFFNTNGIIQVNNVDDITNKVNSLNEKYYSVCKKAIEENYKRALKYVDYEQNIVDTITKLFTENGILAI
jgi:hypothetical protein